MTSPVYYTLATSQKILDAELKRMKVLGFPGIKNSWADATTNFLENGKGDACAVVCIFDHTHDLEQTYAMLVHEAVHIWQAICRRIGEHEPSDEFEAYSVQRISQSLFFEYKRQRRRK